MRFFFDIFSFFDRKRVFFEISTTILQGTTELRTTFLHETSENRNSLGQKTIDFPERIPVSEATADMTQFPPRLYTRRAMALALRRKVLIVLFAISLPMGALFLASALAWARVHG